MSQWVYTVLFSKANNNVSKCTCLSGERKTFERAGEEKKVIRIENYHCYVPTGEQWSIEDKVEIKSGIFTGFSVRRLTE